MPQAIINSYIREPIFPGPTPDFRLDASAIPGLADGNAVATWPDSSGNGRDFTQGTGANQPIFKVNITNGRPCVRFPSSDYLTCATLPLTQSWTMFAVTQNGSSAIQFFFYWGTTNDGFGLFVSADRSVQLRSGGGTTNCTDAAYPTGPTPELWTIRRNNVGPLLELWVDGVSTAISNNTAAQGSTTAAGIVGGFNPAAPSLFWSGVTADIFEIIGYASVLTDPQRAAIEAYLITKYGL